jgi:hypothetical protein
MGLGLNFTCYCCQSTHTQHAHAFSLQCTTVETKKGNSCRRRLGAETGISHHKATAKCKGIFWRELRYAQEPPFTVDCRVYIHRCRLVNTKSKPTMCACVCGGHHLYFLVGSRSHHTNIKKKLLTFCDAFHIQHSMVLHFHVLSLPYPSPSPTLTQLNPTQCTPKECQ